MHVCSSGSVLLVNAEVDSMGGVVDAGVRIGVPSSPQKASIEQAQAELRQKYDARAETKREIEFLEKGGDPLDLKIGNVASVSVQSTSLTDQHPETIVTSEAKGSFALTASPLGDSVESSGILGAPSVCEPNSADNLMLFDGDNEFRVLERKTVHPRRSNIAPSDHFSHLESSLNAKESGDSTAFELPKKAYKRRNRSRPNRDGARSSSTDTVPIRGGYNSLPSRHASRDAKGLIHDEEKQERNLSSNSNSKPLSPEATMALKTVPSDSQIHMDMAGVQTVESTIGFAKGGPSSAASDSNASKILKDNQVNQLNESVALETPTNMVPREAVSAGIMEQVVLVGSDDLPSVVTQKVKDQAITGQINGFSNRKGDRKSVLTGGQNSSARFTTKGLDSESSCTQTSLSLDGNNGSDVCTSLKNINSNGSNMDHTLASEEVPNVQGKEIHKEKIVSRADIVGAGAITNDNSSSLRTNYHENGSMIRTEGETKGTGSPLLNQVDPITVEGVAPDDLAESLPEKKPSDSSIPNSTSHNENACTGRLQGSVDSSTPGLLETTSRGGGSTAVTEQHTCLHNNLKLESKAHEDSVLEEARIIEAKRKRIAELSVGTLPLETRRKSHWDFVLEEMTWLANDFAQERLWKIAASAQVSRRVAFTSRLRFQKQISLQKQKEVAHTLAEAVLEFWRTVQDTSKELEVQCSEKDFALPLQKYAVKFLEYNGSLAQHGAAEAPKTPDRMTDLGTLDISWEDNLTEENLFYTVPSGAVEAYRKSIESHLLHFEKTGSSMLDEAETSAYDAAKDFGSQENMLEEDEGATSTYYLPGAFESSKSAIHAQKKRKMKAYNGRSYELGADYCMENKVGNQQAALIPKRPSNSHNVSIPTKRVRTASRQRVLSPFGAGTSGCVQAPGRADASSGDTNSFQDDQSNLHGGSQIPNSLEAESVGDFEKQLQYDSPEVSNRPKKKKKAKHLGPTYEQRWQLDSSFQNDQRDHLKRRLENHQFESNGRSGLFGQHIPKKPKMIKQSLDNSYDNLTAMGGSIPSPVASQMSNMSNPNKFIRMLGVRDRGRKNKALKTPAGQPGSGSPWSLFEDQALVVLVHDMGPNWELVSDAINSTLQFKCIFRKPKECKERHKILMDRTTGDGADSAEDSGSSQPYPSTLPGIPKGSARQLFQRLQGPMEEDTLKSHFEKIIIIGQKQHYRRIQNDNQDPKQLQQPHSSHALALSQVCPNNLNGVPVLTPLDLCDATAPSPDALPLGFQGAPISGLPTPNQGNVAPILPASGANSSIQGPSNMAPGSNFPSPSAPVNASIRDARYNIPRTASLSVDDQQRMLQYNQMLSGRNIQQNLPVSGAHPGADRGARVLSGANGLGIMGGMNRNMPRPGFQGIASPSMLTSGSGVVANLHSGAGPGQGNSMMRHRDALHMMRPNQNTEHQRQMSVPELQMQQASQGGTNQGAPPFVGGLSSSFPNQTVPPVQSYPLHHQQQTHPMSPQQSPHVLNNNSQHPHHLQATPNNTSNAQHSTAYAIRMAKERHLQQQRLLQQQHQFATSNASLPHGQPPVSQLPISSPQISSQIQPQTSPPTSSSPMMTPSPSTPMPQHPTQKHHVPPAHGGLARNSQTGSNQMAKQQRQRQAQQFQQAGRQHPQQRQQAQQQAKLLKGAGRGAMIMHQNLPMDPSLVNGFSGSQSTAEKGEQQVVNHLMQGGQRGLYSGSSALNSAVQSTSKQSVPHSSSNQLHPQQQPYSGQAQAGSLKQLPQQMLSGSSGNSNSQTPAPPAIASSGAPSVVAPSNQQQQLQPHPKLVNQSQTEAMHRSIHQNRQKNSSELPLSKPQAGEAAHAEQQLGTVPQARSTDAAASEIQPVVSASATQWKASESFFDSSGLVPNHATELGKSCLQPSPPSTNAAVTGSELPGPVVSQGVIQRQSSSDSLSNPVGHDVGVQWLQQQQSSS